MNKFVVLLMLLSTWVKVCAQDVFTITADSLDKDISLTEKYYRYALIKTGQTNINYLAGPQATTLYKTGPADFNANRSTCIAVHFALKNATARDYKIVLPAAGETSVFYIKTEHGEWHRLQTGNGFSANKRDGMKQLLRVVYNLPAGTTTQVYECTTGIAALKYVRPQFSGYDFVVKSYYLNRNLYDSNDVITFAFVGFLAFVMVVNLLFFFVAREEVYFTFAAALFFVLLLYLLDFGVREYCNGYLAYSLEIQSFFVFLATLLFIITITKFLRIPNHFPRWNTFFIVVPVLFFIVLCIKSYNRVGFYIRLDETYLVVVSLLLFMFYIVAFVVLVFKMYKQEPAAKIFVVAIAPFVLACIVAAFKNGTSAFVVPCAIWAIFIITWKMFERYKNLQLENLRIVVEREEEKNKLIELQKQELEQLVKARTAELEDSLEHLKQTQNQLVQSEKMASLGELTAGIAHEIQNPLNFVNNFSDVSVELIEELHEEIEKGDTEEAKALADDIKQNLEKIAHHGRRADSIVKGMLQHSRVSTGQKELTDINALADEYLRLAYHGLRAKDKTFNAELITDFDASLSKINVVSQDLGRVFLNMFTNAFYATQQKLKQNPSYKPVVSVITKKTPSGVEICIRDNGTGIPDNVRDKILQPFFTTKPTGEGTGLGLSLSYDIVVKAHGGSINIVSEEGGFTEFIIGLPLT